MENNIVGTNVPKIFRVSYSILNSWSRGYAEDAIAMYFKLPRETSRQMEEGLMYHKSWEEYINRNKQLHPQLTSGIVKLQDPKCELKLEAMLDDLIQVVGVIDCLDTPTIHEFKSGVKSASEYAETQQGGVYGVLCDLCGYEGVDRVRYSHFNQYDKTHDTAFTWLTEKRKESARKWLTEHGNSMYDYLVKNGYYDKYEVPNHSVTPIVTDEEVLLPTG